MTSTNITKVTRLDNLRDSIIYVIEDCKEYEQKLIRHGVQAGHHHFKPDNSQKNSMFVLEPSQDGKGKYIHVGADPQRQVLMLAKLERFRKLKALNAAREDLEKLLSDIEWQLSMLSNVIEHVEEYARLIHEKYVKRD
ncbi:MAG: hypothetical protein PVI97_11645 [Candidatus Thiodiazotropha sp.]|jgi:hypothetical protein